MKKSDEINLSNRRKNLKEIGELLSRNNIYSGGF